MHKLIGLVSLFNDISTFVGNLMPKKNSNGTIESKAGGSK